MDPEKNSNGCIALVRESSKYVDKPSKSSFDLQHPVYFYTVVYFDIRELRPRTENRESFEWKQKDGQWNPVCPDKIPGPEWTQDQRLAFLKSKYEGRKLAVEVCLVGDAIKIYVRGVFCGDSWVEFFKKGFERLEDLNTGHPGEWLLERAKNRFIAFLICCDIQSGRIQYLDRFLGHAFVLRRVFDFIDTW